MNNKDTTSATSIKGTKYACLPCNEIYAVTSSDGSMVRGVKVRRITTLWTTVTTTTPRSLALSI